MCEFEDVVDFDFKVVMFDGVCVEEWGLLVFVNFDFEVLSFNDMFGEILGEVVEVGFVIDWMEFVEWCDYEVKVNWKVYVDNYFEGYYILIVYLGFYCMIDYVVYCVEMRCWYFC